MCVCSTKFRSSSAAFCGSGPVWSFKRFGSSVARRAAVRSSKLRWGRHGYRQVTYSFGRIEETWYYTRWSVCWSLLGFCWEWKEIHFRMKDWKAQSPPCIRSTVTAGGAPHLQSTGPVGFAASWTARAVVASAGKTQLVVWQGAQSLRCGDKHERRGNGEPGQIYLLVECLFVAVLNGFAKVVKRRRNEAWKECNE